MNSATPSIDPHASEPTMVSRPLEEREILECGQWLGFHRVWGRLPEETLQAIARSCQRLRVEVGSVIYQEGQTPIGLYLLKWGTIEIYRQSSIGQSPIRYRNAGELFGHLLLIANTEGGTYQTSAIALTASEIWFLPQTEFQRLAKDYPELQQVINAFLAQDLTDYARRIAWEQTRIQGLQAYIQSQPTGKTLLGDSKASQKLLETLAS
jgi:CRP-like cAMP-binding protein